MKPFAILGRIVADAPAQMCTSGQLPMLTRGLDTRIPESHDSAGSCGTQPGALSAYTLAADSPLAYGTESYRDCTIVHETVHGSLRSMAF